MKNLSIKNMFFELYYGYYLDLSLKKTLYKQFQSKIINKLIAKLNKLFIIYCENI